VSFSTNKISSLPFTVRFILSWVYVCVVKYTCAFVFFNERRKNDAKKCKALCTYTEDLHNMDDEETLIFSTYILILLKRKRRKLDRKARKTNRSRVRPIYQQREESVIYHTLVQEMQIVDCFCLTASLNWSFSVAILFTCRVLFQYMKFFETKILYFLRTLSFSVPIRHFTKIEQQPQRGRPYSTA